MSEKVYCGRCGQETFRDAQGECRGYQHYGIAPDEPRAVGGERFRDLMADIVNADSPEQEAERWREFDAAIADREQRIRELEEINLRDRLRAHSLEERVTVAEREVAEGKADRERITTLQSLFDLARDLVVSADYTEASSWHEDTRVHGDDRDNTVLLVRPGESLRSAIDAARQAAAVVDGTVESAAHDGE